MSDGNNDTPAKPEEASVHRLGDALPKLTPEQSEALKNMLSRPKWSDFLSKGAAAEGASLGETFARLFYRGPSCDQNLFPFGTTAILAGSREALALEEAAKLRSVIAAKEAELQKKAEKLRIALEAKSATEEDLQSLMRDNGALQKQKDLGYLLDRVCSAAADRLLKDENFVKSFEEAKSCEAFVLSIDIRRSTDLMLRGRTPQLYAEFLDAVCTELSDEIKKNYGVIDKFTGDGLLAYFPVFFSGQDAGYRVLAAAQACHKVFAELYCKERNRFTVALKDVGLGIGIDFGPVHLYRVTRELTVVGAPVVYACRFSGAPAGLTYMNISAQAELEKRCPKAFTFTDAELQIKNEGLVLCYAVALADNRYEPAPPDWLASPPGPAGGDSPKAPAAPDVPATDSKQATPPK